jgi:tRNA (guanine37-N1)-methyltransferase
VRIDIVTLFPGFFPAPLQTSILGRAVSDDHIEVVVHDLRKYAVDRHGTVDDAPFGGGRGMLLKPEPVAACWDDLGLSRGHSIYLSADGERLDQALAIRLSLRQHIVLLCGHYKGVDERARRRCIDQEVSVGDYVLTGGEPAALVLIDAVVRLIPGVLGDFSSAMADSFHDDGLLGGDHARVEAWRRRQALRRTYERRPDLLDGADLDGEERRLVDRWTRSGASDTD